MKRETIRLIRYRLASARETLAEAESLLRDDHRRGAKNRIYYAMFYATLAMLALRNLSSSKHSGAISLFHREFIYSKRHNL